MTERDIHPEIGSMLKDAHDWLAHEHSLFRSLKLDPLLIGKGKTSFALDLPAEFAGADGAVHSSFYTTFMDSIFGLTVFTSLENLQPIATINLRADYFDEAAPGTRVVCAAECHGVHDDVAHVSGEVTLQTSEVLAKGSGAFMVGTRGMMKGSRL